MIAAKVLLVLYVLTGRNSLEHLYAVRYPTEEACQREAAKYAPRGWEAYPLKRAVCVIEVK